MELNKEDYSKLRGEESKWHPIRVMAIILYLVLSFALIQDRSLYRISSEEQLLNVIMIFIGPVLMVLHARFYLYKKEYVLPLGSLSRLIFYSMIGVSLLFYLVLAGIILLYF